MCYVFILAPRYRIRQHVWHLRLIDFPENRTGSLMLRLSPAGSVYLTSIIGSINLLMLFSKQIGLDDQRLADAFHIFAISIMCAFFHSAGTISFAGKLFSFSCLLLFVPVTTSRIRVHSLRFLPISLHPQYSSFFFFLVFSCVVVLL